MLQLISHLYRKIFCLLVLKSPLPQFSGEKEPWREGTWLQDRDGRQRCETRQTGGSPGRRLWRDFSCEYQAPGLPLKGRGSDFPLDSGLHRNCSPPGMRHRPRRAHSGILLWGPLWIRRCLPSTPNCVQLCRFERRINTRNCPPATH